jgi:hypothetical protein
MARQSKEQKETVQRVMHEYKHGELDRGQGGKVKSPKQAIAIALHEAGASKYESSKKNRENLRRTKAEERRGETGQARAEGTRAAGKSASAKKGQRGSDRRTKAELYAQARRRNLPGRSGMSKDELARALGR